MGFLGIRNIYLVRNLITEKQKTRAVVTGKYDDSVRKPYLSTAPTVCCCALQSLYATQLQDDMYTQN